MNGTLPLEILDLGNLEAAKTVAGLEFGVLYALLALIFMQAPVFKKLPNRIEHLIRNMNLNVWDCIFLSLLFYI